LTAIGQQKQRLPQLQASAPIGRVVMHISPDMRELAEHSGRSGRVRFVMRRTFVPKKAGYVMVKRPVFNPTAVSYRPGRSAKWYSVKPVGYHSSPTKSRLCDPRRRFGDRRENNSAGWWGGDPIARRCEQET